MSINQNERPVSVEIDGIPSYEASVLQLKNAIALLNKEMRDKLEHFLIDAKQNNASPEIEKPEESLSQSKMYRTIEVSVAGNATVAILVDEKVIKECRIDQIAEELFGLAQIPATMDLVVSFERVKFLASSMLGKYLTLDKRMKAKGGKLRLCSMTEEVLELFILTNLISRFDIRPDENPESSRIERQVAFE